METLPTEIQLNVISQLQDYNVMGQVCERLGQLASYVSSKKLAHYLKQNTLVMGVYSASLKDVKNKLFYELEMDPYTGKCELGALKFKKNLFQTVEERKEIPVVSNPDYHLDLIVPEHVCAKVYYRCYLWSSQDDTLVPLTELMSVRLNSFSGSAGDEYMLRYKREELEIEQEEFVLYDYESKVNYGVNLHLHVKDTQSLVANMERALVQQVIIDC